MFERYTEKARRVIFFARYEASQFGCSYVETEHLLLGLLREDKALANRFLQSHASAESIRKLIEGHAVFGRGFDRVDLPLRTNRRVPADVGGSGCQPTSILVRSTCAWAVARGKLLRRTDPNGTGIAAEPDSIGFWTKAARAMQAPKRHSVPDELSPCLSDLVAQTEPLVGRQIELDRLIELLCHLNGRNPVLVGEPGVGKKTIVGELGRRMADGNVPRSLSEKTILRLDLLHSTYLKRIVQVTRNGSCAGSGGTGWKNLFPEPDA